jgi:glycosyl transferase family 87
VSRSAHGSSRYCGGLALVAVVVLGFCINAGVRLPCRDVCGSDIGRLYEDRGIDRDHAPFFDRDLEYPPLIGLVMYAAGYPFNHGLRGAFLLNALVLAALAAVTTWRLWRRYGDATRRWALAPPLYISGLTNWDLLAVAPATIGLLEWEVGHAVAAGVLFGVGASAKLFPLLYIPILAASCVNGRDWRRARNLMVGSVIGLGVFTIPVYAVAPHALRHFLHFHAIRGPSRGTFWYYVFRNPSMDLWLRRNEMVDAVNIITATLVVVALIALVTYTARGRLAPIAACALATSAFVVTNKIYSPQYDLWFLPFLVMLPVRTKLVLHFYVSSFLAFLLVATEGHVVGRPLSLYIAAGGVLYRLVVHVLLAREFWVSGRPANTRVKLLTP